MGLMQRLTCEKKTDGNDTASTGVSTGAGTPVKNVKKKGTKSKGKRSRIQSLKLSKK